MKVVFKDFVVDFNHLSPTEFTALILEENARPFEVSGLTNWDFRCGYNKLGSGGLDAEGDVFEIEWELVLKATPSDPIDIRDAEQAKELSADARKIKELFDFLEDNKRTYFEALELKGVVL